MEHPNHARFDPETSRSLAKVLRLCLEWWQRGGLGPALPGCLTMALLLLSSPATHAQQVTALNGGMVTASAQSARGQAPEQTRDQDQTREQEQNQKAERLGLFPDPPAVVWDAADPQQDDQWEFKDPAGWRFTEVAGQRVLSQFLKASAYQPPHRSPLHMALLKHETFDSFQMDAWVKSTHPEYGHRDVCLFFGYAGPDRFYYVHMASEMDDRANQIFVVDAADRTKISDSTTPGTRWDDDWHHVRIQRHHTSGKILVFFDNMENPIMTAVHSGLGAGQIGFGSFDDTADFRRLEIRRWQP